jgi:hypothetical protein
MASQNIAPEFGRLDISPITNENQSAHFHSQDWNSLSQAIEVRMYLTQPGSNEPIELGSSMLNVPPMPPVQKKSPIQ